MTALKLIGLVMFLGVSGLGFAGFRLSPAVVITGLAAGFVVAITVAAVINNIIKGMANG